MLPTILTLLEKCVQWFSFLCIAISGVLYPYATITKESMTGEKLIPVF